MMHIQGSGVLADIYQAVTFPLLVPVPSHSMMGIQISGIVADIYRTLTSQLIKLENLFAVSFLSKILFLLPLYVLLFYSSPIHSMMHIKYQAYILVDICQSLISQLDQVEKSFCPFLPFKDVVSYTSLLSCSSSVPLYDAYPRLRCTSGHLPSANLTV